METCEIKCMQWTFIMWALYHTMGEFQYKKKIYIKRVLRSFYACLYVYIFFRGFIKHTQYSFQWNVSIYFSCWIISASMLNAISIAHFLRKNVYPFWKCLLICIFVYFINKWGVKYRKKELRLVKNTCNSLSGNTLYSGKKFREKTSFINGLQKRCPVFGGVFFCLLRIIL